MANENILLFLSDPNIGTMLERGALRPAGYEVTIVLESETAEILFKNTPPDLVILGEKFQESDGFILEQIIGAFPSPAHDLAVRPGIDQAFACAACWFYRLSAATPRTGDVIRCVQNSLDKRRKLVEWSSLEARRSPKSFKNA